MPEQQMKGQSVPIAVELSRAQYQALCEIAAEHNTTVDELVSQITLAYLTRRKNEFQQP